MRTLTTCVLLSLGSSVANARQHPLNLSFESPSVEGYGRPWGWTVVSESEGAQVALDSAVSREGHRSLRIARAVSDSGLAEGWAGHALRFWIPPRFAWGDSVRLVGWVRADALDGAGRIVLEAWGAGVLDADTASLEHTTDGEAWRQLSVAIGVDSSAHSVVVTAALTGTGTVWFDDFTIDAFGRRWASVPVASVPTDADLAWLERRSAPLSTVDPSIDTATPDFSDLSAFARIVGDAKIVALGEATHGTSEFFRIKHRLTEFLVRELGFRVFMIEANQLAVESINQYVLRGLGDAQTAMKTMFRVWNTEEMLHLIEWLRSYNASHPDRTVEFIGFDMQDPSLPIDSIHAFLGRVAPALQPVTDSLYRDYREAWRRSPYPFDTDSVRQQWLANADDAWHVLEPHRENWLRGARSRTDTIRIEWAIQNANVVRQSARNANATDFAIRDSAMAENIRWVLDHRDGGTRAVVWAHDAHISKAADSYANYFRGKTMGAFASRIYGDGYRSFGLLTYRGKYSGLLENEFIDVDLFPAPAGSVEEALHRIAERSGTPILISDLRGAAHGPSGAWLVQPRLIRMIGYAAEDWGFATPIAVGRQFDGLVFVDVTTPSRLVSRD